MIVTHLFNPDKGSRYPLMISEGLIAHPDIELHTNADVTAFGKIKHYRTPAIEDAIRQSDLIFRPSSQHFDLRDLDDFIGRGRFWRKIIVYDFADSNQLDWYCLDQCLLYAKRTWDVGRQSKVVPLHYCILDEYLTMPIDEERKTNVAYLFGYHPDLPTITNRNRVYKALESAGFENSIIGTTTIERGQNGRRAILEPFEPSSPFWKYMAILTHSKVVWTCGPDHAGGDSRIWEAFASGALVVSDFLPRNLSNRFDPRHYISYDSSSIQSINGIIKFVNRLLSKDVERQKIATMGRDHAIKYHRPINRINEVLGAL